jgi:uncharacterized protein
MNKTLQLIVILIFFLGTSMAAEKKDVPYLSGRVTDNANIVSAETIRLLTDSLKAYEARTGNQIVVFTVAALNGEAIEDYANMVFNEWKLGQKGKNNGVLIIVAPNDRRMRIEVGYGLEATLTDVLASRIVNNIMTPKFKNGDYNGGITEGTMAVVKVLEGGALAETEQNADAAEGKSGFSGIEAPDMPITERILFGAFIFGIIGLFTFMGIITPGMGRFLYPFLIPFWATFPIIVVGTTGALIGLIIYLIGFPLAKLILKRTNWYKKAKNDIRTKGSANIGGFVFSSGGFGGSGSSGSSWSSGSSGFSGGGGSSGGGGASGSW